MKFLRSRKQWRRWVRTVEGAVWDNYDDNGERVPGSRVMVPEPERYPCWAYAVVQSFTHVEERPVYLYRSEVDAMFCQFLPEYRDRRAPRVAKVAP